MDEELLAEFLIESNENLSSIEDELLNLEADPGNSEILDAIFRVIHTVKGNCGFLGLQRLEKVAHAGENLLGKIRAKGFHVDGDMVSLLLENSDAIKAFIAGVEEHGAEPELDFTALCVRLSAAERLIDQGLTAAEAQATVTAVSAQKDVEVSAESALSWLTGIDAEAVTLIEEAGLSSPASVLEAGFERLRSIEGLKPAVALKILGLAKSSKLKVEAVIEAEAVEAAVELQPVVEEESAVNPGALSQEQTKAVASMHPAPVATPMQQSPVKSAPARKPVAESSIRVDVALLDELMNQVGELVLSRNRLLRLVGQSEQGDLVRTCRNISQTTTMLQEKLLHTRMQPISTLWSSVPRLLRDISKQLGKKIAVHMQGQETELDRTILAAMKDPMTHIIRNSCDHGIETPDVRHKNGKPKEGTISLSARQASGFIMIDIHDDGGGIPAHKIREKAVRMGV